MSYNENTNIKWKVEPRGKKPQRRTARNFT